MLVTMASVSPNGTNAIVTTIVGTCQMNETAAMVLSLLATMEIVSQDHTNATVTMIAAMDLMNETVLDLLHVHVHCLPMHRRRLGWPTVRVVPRGAH